MGTPKAVAVPAAAAVEKNLRRDAMTDMLCLRGMEKMLQRNNLSWRSFG